MFAKQDLEIWLYFLFLNCHVIFLAFAALFREIVQTTNK